MFLLYNILKHDARVNNIAWDVRQTTGGNNPEKYQPKLLLFPKIYANIKAGDYFN
jgi:hypothetical protein